MKKTVRGKVYSLSFFSFSFFSLPHLVAARFSRISRERHPGGQGGGERVEEELPDGELDEESKENGKDKDRDTEEVEKETHEFAEPSAALSGRRGREAGGGVLCTLYVSALLYVWLRVL